LIFTDGVLFYCIICKSKNVSCGAVIFLKEYCQRSREIILKVHNVTNVGPSPAIDILICITYNADVVVCWIDKKFYKGVLCGVRVLVLINMHIFETPLVVFTNICVL